MYKTGNSSPQTALEIEESNGLFDAIAERKRQRSARLYQQAKNCASVARFMSYISEVHSRSAVYHQGEFR